MLAARLIVLDWHPKPALGDFQFGAAVPAATRQLSQRRLSLEPLLRRPLGSALGPPAATRLAGRRAGRGRGTGA